MLLSLKNISVHYKKAIALENVSLEVAEGSVVAIIGANGSGKSTILRTVSGLKRLTSGEILFQGKRIDGLTPYQIVRNGITHIPEGRRLFPYLTVLSNLKLGAVLRKDEIAVQKDMDEVFKHFPKLWGLRHQKAITLSGGEQAMLAIGRGLMSNPKLIMMDEPSIGLAPIIVDELVPVIKNINKKGVSVLLIEQNVPLALEVAHYVYALQLGKIVLASDGEELKSNDIIKEAYLGG